MLSQLVVTERRQAKSVSSSREFVVLPGGWSESRCLPWLHPFSAQCISWVTCQHDVAHQRYLRRQSWWLWLSALFL
jgi:hypothetical protein